MLKPIIQILNKEFITLRTSKQTCKQTSQQTAFLCANYTELLHQEHTDTEQDHKIQGTVTQLVATLQSMLCQSGTKRTIQSHDTTYRWS